eukprot:5256523-Pleurochrysis_carterae.AAC.5
MLAFVRAHQEVKDVINVRNAKACTGKVHPIVLPHISSSSRMPDGKDHPGLTAYGGIDFTTAVQQNIITKGTPNLS